MTKLTYIEDRVMVTGDDNSSSQEQESEQPVIKDKAYYQTHGHTDAHRIIDDKKSYVHECGDLRDYVSLFGDSFKTTNQRYLKGKCPRCDKESMLIFKEGFGCCNNKCGYSGDLIVWLMDQDNFNFIDAVNTLYSQST